MTDQNRKTKTLPAAIWNQHPFTCPGCDRNWPPGQIRICLYARRWVCQRCRDSAMGRVVTNAGQRIECAFDTECDTCHRQIRHRRAVINIHGRIVHYRCPKKAPT